MNTNDVYTIDPMPKIDYGSLVVGDIIDLLTGDIIVGPYCEWPKRMPRRFIVTWTGDVD